MRGALPATETVSLPAPLLTLRLSIPAIEAEVQVAVVPAASSAQPVPAGRTPAGSVVMPAGLVTVKTEPETETVPEGDYEQV